MKIKEEIREFLSTELDLVMNEVKTKTIHCVSQKSLYLGFEIGRRSRRYTESLKSTTIHGLTRRASNTRIQIYAPIDKIVEKLIDHKFAIRKDKPCAITK
jgi:hypothetical protein